MASTYRTKNKKTGKVSRQVSLQIRRPIRARATQDGHYFRSRNETDFARFRPISYQ